MRYAIPMLGASALVAALAVWVSSLAPFAQQPQGRITKAEPRQPVVPLPDEPPPPSPLLLATDVRLPLEGSQQLSVRAKMSDGMTEDVTRLVKFASDNKEVAKVSAEGVVKAVGPGRTIVRARYGKHPAVVRVSVSFVAALKTKAQITPAAEFKPVNFIDELAAKEWESVGLEPVGPTTDSLFARRVYQHLLGRLPTVRELQRFWGFVSENKRARLVDQLLKHPDHARHWRDVWGEWLFVPIKTRHKQELKEAGRWLREAMAENRPLDRLVRELLTAYGDPRENGAAAFYVQHDSAPAAARAISQRVLGGPMECARCHPHPSQAWTPEDWRTFEACFSNVQRRKRPDGVMEVVLGPAAKADKPTVPGIFGQRFQPPGPQSDPRTELADWLTGEGRLLLARALVNHYWRHLFGRGLVEPYGDLRTSREAILPTVLEALARDLVRHRFDGKHLLRTICRSRLYQLESSAKSSVGDDEGFHARYQAYRAPYPILPITLRQVTESEKAFTDLMSDYDAGMPWFLATPPPYFFGTTSRPPRASDCGAEDPNSPPLASALHLLNSPLLQDAITDPRGRLTRRLASGLSDERIIEEVFLVTLSRRPKEDELRVVRQHIAKHTGSARPIGFQDILWALINTKEFLFVQ